MHQEIIRLVNDRGQSRSLSVRVADDPMERASGFQYICPEVIQHTLILFRFPQPIRTSFHMANVRAPLDIAFFDAYGKVVGVQRMQPYTEDHQPLYGPGVEFQYALEAPEGFLSQWGIRTERSRLVLE